MENFTVSPYVIFTTTVNGKFSGIHFQESELITQIAAQGLHNNDYVLKAECNFGKILAPSYEEPVKKKKSNRGRKKKIIIKKPRRIQGNGTCFNSQITFLVETLAGRRFNIKVFRPGEFEIHGIPQGIIEEGHEAIETLSTYLQKLFGEGVVVEAFNIIMTNVKFLILPSTIKTSEETIEELYPVLQNHHINKYIIKLKLLYDILSILKAAQNENENELFGISRISYSLEKTRLSLRFRTPLIENPKKLTLVTIYMSGKVNVLGGKGNDNIAMIHKYIKDVVANNPQIISKLY
ncbi:MAG: hypothetical protein KAS12_01460 [Candidatus Aenigmarchaeota archaeon]|nr:hypothetical protein [Candidatus Aenigmarchaeota archaeon]